MASKGTTRERSPGTWQLRVCLGRDGQGKPIQVGRFFKGGKRQAQAELARLMVEVEHRTAPLEGPVTVAQLLERWLEHIRPSSCPPPGPALGASHSGHHRLGEPPPMHARPPTVPDPSAVQGLVTAAEEENPVLAMAIVLAAITGSRLGELCGLRWSDIDLDNNLLHIRRAVKHGLDKRELVVGPTTHQHRRVSLDPTAQTILASHRRRVEGWAMSPASPHQLYVVAPAHQEQRRAGADRSGPRRTRPRRHPFPRRVEGAFEGPSGEPLDQRVSAGEVLGAIWDR